MKEYVSKVNSNDTLRGGMYCVVCDELPVNLKQFVIRLN